MFLQTGFYALNKTNCHTMNVVITGSSGYLGSILVKLLVSRKIHVTGIDIRSNNSGFDPEYFTFYKCCITDRENLEEIFLKEQPTHVVHFACSFNKIRDRKLEYAIDVGGSNNILDISNRTISVMQLIYSSSAAAYGGCSDNADWISESHPLRPGNYTYGINKKLIERSYLSSPVRENLHILVLRICSVTGPSFPKERVVLRLLTRFPALPGFCRLNKIQLLHEEDFLSLMELIILDENIEGIFNIAPETYSFISDIVPDKKYISVSVGFIKSVLWILWQLHILNLQPASISNSFFPIILDPSKVTTRYGYRFKYSTAEAFSETINKSTDSLPHSREW